MRPENDGGCVSIFFHLFSKKKQPKLLPSPLSRVANTEEKVSTSNLVVIADENLEECVKPELEIDPDLDNTMQAAGLVARLMGLETMPIVHNEKRRKALDLKFCSDSGFEYSTADDGSKLEKMGKSGRFLERRPVEGFRKGLGLYGSRKKHCMKLESPVKSPRMVVRSNASRLVQVANKILQPGLQASDQANLAISSRGGLESESDGGRERLCDSLSGSCNSFKSWVGVKDNLVAKCASSASDLSNGSEERRKQMGSRSKVKGEEGHKMKASVQVNSRSVAIQAKVNVENRAHDVMATKKSSANIGDQCETSTLRKNNLKKQTEKNQNGLGRGKNFIALNKNLNNYARSRSPTKVLGSCRVESERDSKEKYVAQKTSLVNRNLKVFDNSFNRGRRSDVISRKETGFVSNHSVNKSCTKVNSQPVNCDSFNKSDKNGVVSFTFNSPMPLRRRKGEGEHNHNACHSRKLISDEKTESLSSGKAIALKGDELSNLLEEKIRELSSFNQPGDDIQGRSTISILEELISALTTGAPDLHKNGETLSDASFQTEISVSPNHTINTDEDFQEKAQPGICTAYLVDVSNQPSPVSILEASFSNDTCSMESLNDNSESRPQFGLPEDCNNTQSSYQDLDISNSATSLDICCLTEVGISGTDVGPTIETVSDAELMFENLSLYGSDGTVESLDSFLLDTLENTGDVLSVNFNLTNERNQLREFLYDCIMECLDFKFSHFCRSGFRTWLKLPSILKREQLMSEIHVEIRGWGSLAGKTLDDLVEKELSWSNSKWTFCETEAFEAEVEIQNYMLHMLIEEIVIDLC